MKCNFRHLIIMAAALTMPLYAAEIDPDRGILNVPADRLTAILHEWCAPKDIAAVDSAFLVKKHREEFVQIIDDIKKRITVFEIKNKEIRDDGLNRLLKSFQKVTSLSLDYCQNLTVRNLVALAGKFKELKSISLEGWIITNYPQVPVDDIVSFANIVPKLESINLRKNGRLCAHTDKAIALFKHLPKLRMIDYSHHTYLDNHLDRLVCAIAESCPDLRNIDLSMSCDLTDISIVALANGCKHLETINLEGGSSRRDTMFWASYNGENMENPDLYGRSLLTDLSFITLGNECPNLKWIKLPFKIMPLTASKNALNAFKYETNIMDLSVDEALKGVVHGFVRKQF